MTARPMSRGAGPPWSRVDGLFAKPVANFVRHPADSKAAQAVRENFLRFADEGGCLDNLWGQLAERR